MTDWLSNDEMATRLGCHPRSLLRMREAGLLLPGAHYIKRGLGKKAPLMWNPSAVELALRYRTALMVGGD